MTERRLFHELERRHAPIAKHFQSGAGCWLQWYDSRMADRILIEATRQVIQDRLIGYFHVDAGNPATDIELGAAGLLCALAERLELAAHSLRDCEWVR
jgi:hypothetical protein